MNAWISDALHHLRQAVASFEKAADEANTERDFEFARQAAKAARTLIKSVDQYQRRKRVMQAHKKAMR